MADRVILHCDLNNCYASIECLHRPEYRNIPLAVGGDTERRHGIILAKNQIAKAYGVQTGEALWQARRKCAPLVIVPPNFSLYLRFSALSREIFRRYTDQVEPFGIDEAWLDVSGSAGLFGDGRTIADEVRRRIREELGITASVGVSFNKIFAKLGSDYQKPDATTVFSRKDIPEKVWPLPVGELLYVGRATAKKLAGVGLRTIGDLAGADPWLPRHLLGKWGEILQTFARGKDLAPVARYDDDASVKSIGNSTTAPRDLVTWEDVRMILWVLSESVAARMREQGFVGSTVRVSLRDQLLRGCTRQGKLLRPTCLSSEIAAKAGELLAAEWREGRPLRSLGVSVTDFSYGGIPLQLDFYTSQREAERREQVERAVDTLRRRFGPYSVQRASLLRDPELTHFAPKEEHIIHPYSYF